MRSSVGRGAPGPHNDITDVPGISVGSCVDHRVRSGVTVVIPDSAAIAAGDVRGGGPGTRETDLLDPATLVQTADAIVLSGGSSYGLGAADAVAAWLGARGRGFQLSARQGVPPSPIVPAAILYDLANGGDKSWGEAPPYAAMARAACEAACRNRVALGRAGAGFGARAGAVPGGLGSASYIGEDGLVVGALMAVNCVGSVRMPGSRAFWAWPFELAHEFGGARPEPEIQSVCDWPPDTKFDAGARTNTTIGVVAIAAGLTQAEARRVAVMAQDGLARAIRPVHGPTDGDAIFVLATGGAPCSEPLALTRIGMIAADCVSRAIARGVFEAEQHAPET